MPAGAETRVIERAEPAPSRRIGRAARAIAARRWPIPLLIGTGALLVAVAGNDARPFVGLPLAATVIAFAALSTALYEARTTVGRLLPELSPYGLGLFRIAWAIALLHVLPFIRAAIHGAPFPRSDQRSDSGVLDIAPAHWLASHPNVVHAIGTVTVVALILFAIGLFARMAYAVAAAGFAAHGLAAAMAQGLHDWDLPIVVILCLVVIPWGDGFGVDDLVRRLRGRPRPRRASTYALAIWLPGFLLGIAWLAAAYAKINHSGLAWITGGAVRYHFVSDYGRSHTDWGLWIASHPTAAVIAAAAGVLFEATFILHAFFRNAWVRLAFLIGAALFFAGLYELQGIHWTAWWILLVALLPWEPVARAVRRILPKYTVEVDGACTLCRRTARILHGLDWFDRLTFVDASRSGEQQPEHIVAIGREGRTRHGLEAYVAVARALPLLAPFTLLTALPPARRMAERVYKRIAARRRRCGNMTCERGPLPSAREAFAVGSRALGLVACVLITGIFVQQAIVSDRRVEREPFFTNFPMYSFTYASPSDYDQQHRSFTDFRFYRYEPVLARSQLLSKSNEVFPMPAAAESVLSLARGAPIPLLETEKRTSFVKVFTNDRKGDDIEPRARGKFMRFAARARTVSGIPVSQVAVTGDLYGFDWHRGRFGVKRANVLLGVLDVRTLKVMELGNR